MPCRCRRSSRSVRMRPPMVAANRSAPARLADDLFGVSSTTVNGWFSSSLPLAAAMARITAVTPGSPSDRNRRCPVSPASASQPRASRTMA
eukprot:1796560-Heterocapsa_arctica.AAC.1